MQLQTTQMMLMNYGVVYLLNVIGNHRSINAILVTNGEDELTNLVALDFGTLNGSGRTLLTVVQGKSLQDPKAAHKNGREAPTHSLHRVGVTLPMDMKENATQSSKYASLVADGDQPLQLFDIGGAIGAQRREILFQKQDHQHSPHQAPFNSCIEQMRHCPEKRCGSRFSNRIVRSKYE